MLCILFCSKRIALPVHVSALESFDSQCGAKDISETLEQPLYSPYRGQYQAMVLWPTDATVRPVSARQLTKSSS